MDTTVENRRRHPRVWAPKGMLVAWQSGGQRHVSHAETVGMGGLFLFTPNPPPEGSMIEMLFDLATPAGEVRARAVVRHTRPGKGMGIKFIHMRPEDRSRLNQFLKLQLESGQTKTGAKKEVSWQASWFTRNVRYLDPGTFNGHHSLFFLLHNIYSDRMTGILQIVADDVEKLLYFNSGQLIFASSTATGDRLDEMMLRAGALTESQVQYALEGLSAQQAIGDNLVALGLCSKAELKDWVHKQVTRIAVSLLDCTVGRFCFFTSFDQRVVPELGIKVPLGKLLLDAVHSATDLPLDQLGKDQALLVDASPDPVLRFQTVELDDEEQRLFATISHPMRSVDIIQAAGISGPRTARALYALLVLGMIVTVTPDMRSEQSLFTPISPPEPIILPDEPMDPQAFEQELQQLLSLTGKGTHYELLGVTPESPKDQIKRSFYALARKFHPDRHMGRNEWIELLQKLMAALTEAYKTLVDEERKAAYNARLAASKATTETQETIEECINLANRCMKDNNITGSIFWLRKCVRMAPNASKYHTLLAVNLGMIVPYRKEAIEHFEKAIELEPFNTSAYFQFAGLYEQMQLPWRAVPLYSKILEIDPQHSETRERLARLEVKQEKKTSSSVSRLFGKKSKS
ncbi:MAG TPA: DUF4388 domain-containing protein [Candidatus Dormibacteraeota bacterium]|nr:DUF4388 domain-containing protein [Candidatus Dormibacteraeota bacterium]